jgi:hypothetical protein
MALMPFEFSACPLIHKVVSFEEYEYANQDLSLEYVDHSHSHLKYSVVLLLVILFCMVSS